MSEVAIHVEGLSKVYRIRRSSGVAQYHTLRDDLIKAAGAPLRWLTGKNPNQTEAFQALDSISFDVREGEVVGIIGRNGAGKSTLLKLLSRITEPSSGRAEIYGRVGSLLEVGTGFHPELTGRENIFLSGAILGMRRDEVRRKLDEIVAFAEVEKFLDTPAKHYSSGMYVRLAFAVAAHLEPEILIVDEVLAVGDALFQRKCLGKMSDVARQGRTVLFVSHTMTAIRTMCSRVLLLQKGKLVGDHPPAEAIRRYLDEMREGTYATTWDPAKAPRNGSALLRRAAITDETGGDLEDIYTDTAFFFDLDFEVLEAGTYVGLTLILHDAENNCVFSSINNLEQTWYGKQMPTGWYRSRCAMPANLLNNGWYSATVNLFSKGFSDVVTAKDALRFEVIDGHAIRGDYFGGFSGVIRPRLAWATATIAKPGAIT